MRDSREQRDRLIAALWGNSNYDSKEGQKFRQERIEQYQKQHERAEALIYGEQEQEEVDISKDPFMRPALEAAKRIQNEQDALRADKSTPVSELLKEADVDQA